ncbi:CPBP family intramembrane glutamic endopeptidase [Dactylosporangium sp. CS-047395]|uniref:CPBP family intramembrane glutamic endopeptidase n=1 Tax=Dactylosporangium sp. CS-047395 TaxID=3239936 RepID=UPI003D942A6F
MIPWPQPHFGPAGATVLALVAAWFVVRIARSPGTVARRRAEIEARPDGRVRFHQRYVLSWWLLTLVTLIPLLTDPALQPRDYGLVLPGPGWIAFALGVFVLFVGIVWARDRFLRHRLAAVPPKVAFLLPRTARERRWGVATAFTAGICEELVFRGALLAGAVGLLHLPIVAAGILVSLFFGLGHLYQGAFGVIGTTLFGLFATALYVVTGSLLLPVLIHAAVDLGPFALTRYREPVVGDDMSGAGAPRHIGLIA